MVSLVIHFTIMKSELHPLIIFLLFSSFSVTRAQESTQELESFNPHHSLSIVLSHAHVFDGRDIDGKRSTLVLPSWGLDYNYHINPKWSIGLHTDIIIEKFKVEKHLESGGSGEVIERSFPIAPALVGTYTLNHHWKCLFGAGTEIAKEGNFFLNRAAIEYGVELPKRFELVGSITYDIKWGAYDTWVLGIGVNKAL